MVKVIKSGRIIGCPLLHNRRFVSPCKILEPNTMINEPIEMETYSWKAEIIINILFPFEFELILKIPLSPPPRAV